MYPVGKGLSKDLECKASGSPVPAVSFKKGGTPLPGAKQTAADATSVTMKIAYVANAAKDAGTIVCEAKSPVGTVTRDIKIEMLGICLFVCLFIKSTLPHKRFSSRHGSPSG